MAEELDSHKDEIESFLTKTKKELSQDGESISFMNADEFKPIVEAAISEVISKDKTNITNSTFIIEGASSDAMMAEEKAEIKDFPEVNSIKSRIVLRNDPKNEGSLETFYVYGESTEKELRWKPEITIKEALTGRFKPQTLDERVKDFMTEKFGEDKEVKLFLEPGDDVKKGNIKVVIKDPGFIKPAPPSLAVIYEPPREKREEDLAKLIYGINMTDVNSRLENAGSEDEIKSLQKRKETLEEGGWEVFLQSAKDHLKSEEEYAKAEESRKKKAKTGGDKSEAKKPESGSKPGNEPTEDLSYVHREEFKRTVNNLGESLDNLVHAESALLGVKGHDALGFRSEFPQSPTGPVDLLNFKFPNNMKIVSASDKEKFKRNEHFSALAWKEYKKGSQRFRQKYNGVVIGSRFDGEKRVDVTLADLEKALDKYFPEDGFKDVYTDNDFNVLAAEKVRLLSTYIDFIKTRSRGRKINKVSFTGPLSERDIFAENVKKTKDKDKNPTPSDMPVKPAGSKTEKDKTPEEKEYDGIFVLKYPRPGAKRYRLLRVEVYSDTDHRKLDNIINILAWETRKSKFLEVVDWDGKKADGASTFQEKRVFKNKGRREKGKSIPRSGEINDLDIYFDKGVEEAKADPNRVPQEWKVVVQKKNDPQTLPVRIDQREISQEKVEDVWKYVLSAKVNELNESEIGLMRRNIFDLFPALQKRSRTINVSPEDRKKLREIDIRLYNRGNKLDTPALLSDLKKYGEIVGLKI